MSTEQTSTTDASAEPLAAPAGLNLLGSPDAGGCCGGGSCAVPSE